MCSSRGRAHRVRVEPHPQALTVVTPPPTALAGRIRRLVCEEVVALVRGGAENDVRTLVLLRPSAFRLCDVRAEEKAGALRAQTPVALPIIDGVVQTVVAAADGAVRPAGRGALGARVIEPQHRAVLTVSPSALMSGLIGHVVD